MAYDYDGNGLALPVHMAFIKSGSFTVLAVVIYLQQCINSSTVLFKSIALMHINIAYHRGGL